jgi:hypothetical protein
VSNYPFDRNQPLHLPFSAGEMTYKNCNSSTESIWESVKVKLSGFFRKIRGWWQTITGTSDPVEKADLLDHKLMDEKLDHKSMDEKLDQLIKQLEHDHPKIKNELPEFYATVKPILQSSLANSKRMREEFDYASRGIAYKQKEISQNIEPILLDWEGKKPIEVLGNRIASSLSLDVAKDQEGWFTANFSAFLFTFSPNGL